MVIDLHLNYYTEFPLQTQIEIFEKALDNALFQGETDIIVIHGIGNGILKNALHDICKKHPHVLSVDNEYHPLYGFGSSKIIFK